MIIYNNKIHAVDESDETIDFIIEDHDAVFHVEMAKAGTAKPEVIGTCSMEDQVLIKKEFKDHEIVVYIKLGRILAAKAEKQPNEAFQRTESSFEISFKSLSPLLSYKQTGETSFSLYDSTGKYLFSIHDLASDAESEYVCTVDLGVTSTENRYVLLGKAQYSKFYLFIVYDLFKKEVLTNKVVFTIDSNEAGLDIELAGPSLLEVSYEEEFSLVDFKKITGKGTKIFDFYELEKLRQLHMLGNMTINGVKYFIHNKNGGVYMTRANAIKVSGFKANMSLKFLGKNLYIWGRNTHYAYKANEKYEYLYLEGKEEPLARFVRPLKVRFIRRFGYFKVPAASIAMTDEGKHNFYLGDQKSPLHIFKLKRGKRKAKELAVKKFKDHASIIRMTGRGNVSATTSFSPEEFTFTKRVSKKISGLKNSKTALKVFRSIFVLMGRMPRKEKLVIFESFHAKQYSDSPRAIYEYMKENHKDYRLLWSIDKSAEKLFEDFEVPYVRRFTPRWFMTFPRAKYWVNNVRLPRWMPKPEGTVYLQTWHGTPLKKLGIDIGEIHMPGTNTNTYKRNFVAESEKWDYLVSPNAYSTEIFKRAFHYKGKVIESGYPRNDVLSNHNETLLNSIKQKLGIPADKKVMLYAPTWRDNEFYQKGKYKFEFQFDLENWKKEYGSEWVLLSRMHYLVAENFDFSAHEGIVYDVSSYPDIRDLYLISDLMITDYSSVFFDYAVLNRPIVFFMYDLELYRDQLRGFYIDIENDSPGPIVETEEELFKAINELKDSNVQLDSKFSAFQNKFSSLEDGHATERVVNAFLE